MRLQRILNADSVVIVGVNNDEQFRPVMMFGLGGILVDIYQYLG